MKQALQARFELDEDTEVGQFGDLALDHVGGLIPAGDVGLPRVFLELLEPQGDPLAVLIDVQHLATDTLAFFKQLVGMTDLARPAHVGDVQQSVDPFLDLDEGTVVGEVADRALDHGAGRVLAGHLVPGVDLGLLHAQGDFLLVLVDAKDHDFDLVANVDQLAGVVDPLGPAHLRDVDQALDTLLELDKGPVAHDVDHLADDAGAHRVLVGHILPGTGALLLEPQRDLFPVLVDVQDHDLDLVVDLEHVAGMVDTAPAHVGDMQQSVDTSQVDEGTEVGDVLDRSLSDLADLDFLEELLLLLFAGDLDQLAAADHDIA